MAEWPGEARRRPPITSFTWSVRRPLAAWLEAEADDAARLLGRYRVLDVGCGVKPYYPFFAPHAASYVGMDVERTPSADVVGVVEDIPLPDGSFDVVLCNQVLEHCADPARAVRELCRVTAPGGRVLASTHGVQVYHPTPDDLWRWTHAGLERLFRENGDWERVSVTPGAGTAACLAMLAGLYLDLAAQKGRIRRPMGLVVASLNRAAAAIDRRAPSLCDPRRPGTLHANYHVVAERPRA